MKKQADVIFFGDVQGVGFRYTVVNLADNFPVSGWVENLPDGSVEILVQGEESIIAEFLKKIENYFKRNIDDKIIKWQGINESLADFTIKYS